MPDETVSESSKSSGEANPMEQKPANPTDGQVEQAKEAAKKAQ